MKKVIRVGSRESVLAVRQAEIVINSIQKCRPDLNMELVTIKTKGDTILDKSLDTIGGKGLFIKELEQALLDCEIDIAVHSYKDMPYEETEELPIVSLSQRESPFDVLVLPRPSSSSSGMNTMDVNKPIGSSSRRRSIQCKELYKNYETKPIRGNVITRLNKLDNGEYSAIILAQAGLNRLHLQHRISKVFSLSEMIPSASQGILAVQGRKGEDYSYLADFHSKQSEIASRAERQFLKTLHGGCSSPVAAYAEIQGKKVIVRGMYVDDLNNVIKGSMEGTAENAEQIGEKLALMLTAKAVQK